MVQIEHKTCQTSKPAEKIRQQISLLPVLFSSRCD